MPVLATTGAMSAKGFSGYTVQKIAGNNWIAYVAPRYSNMSFDRASSLYLSGDKDTDPANAFVLKASTSGTLIWQKSITNGAGNSYGIIAGNILATSSNVFVGGQAKTNSTSFKTTMLYSLDPSAGTVQYARQITSNLYASSVYAIKATPDGNLFFSNSYTDSGFTQATGHLIKATASTGTISSIKNRTPSFSAATVIASDYLSNIYITGGESTATVIVKMDSNFFNLWVKNFGSAVYIYGGVESNGYLYACGQDRASGSAMVMKMDGLTGNILWAKLFSTSGQASGIDVDASDNVYVTVTANSRPYIFCADTNGTLIWQRSFYDGTATVGKQVFVDTVSNNFYYFVNKSSYPNYCFLSALPTDGSLTGTYTVGPRSVVYSVSTESYGNVTYTPTSPLWTLSSGGLTATSPTLTINNSANTFTKVAVP
jgi:hypothetical protein